MNRKERRVAEKHNKVGSVSLTNPALIQLFNQALALQQVGQFSEATVVCQQMLTLQPTNADVLALGGTLQLQQSNAAECIKWLDRAVALNAQNATAYTHRGIAHFNLRAYDKALADYDKAILLSPRTADIYNNRGFTFFTIERYNDAVANYDKALTLKPDYYEALVNKGDALAKLERNDEAIAVYDKAISSHSQPTYAYNNRANALASQKRYQEALASSDRAIALNANVADLHNTRATILKSLDRTQEAIVSAEKALALNPRLQDAWVNRGSAFHQLGDYQNAIESYDKALEINHLRAETLWNKSHSLLVLGDYENGWRLYESRFQTAQLRKDINDTSAATKPKWLGDEDLAGKTILLYHEQGLGDTIQFCRYAPMVEALGAKIIMQVPSSLVSIFSTIQMKAHIIDHAANLSDYDYRCPFMSLPLAFKTTLETVPAKVPYLYTDSKKTALWKEKLGQQNKQRVGLIWSGGTVHKNDRNRSVALEQFLPLLDNHAEFHCLQKEVREMDAEMLSKSNIMLHSNDLYDFTDTAALIDEMDLVISVDTSVAHLAGALGKPVWILLSYVPDFRWLVDRQDSPWYPTAKLFRQTEAGNWQDVIEKVKSELQSISTKV